MYNAACIGARVYAPFRGCEMEVRHLKPAFDLGQVTINVRVDPVFDILNMVARCIPVQSQR
jgi:hypothetical protein